MQPYHTIMHRNSSACIKGQPKNLTTPSLSFFPSLSLPCSLFFSLSPSFLLSVPGASLHSAFLDVLSSVLQDCVTNQPTATWPPPLVPIESPGVAPRGNTPRDPFLPLGTAATSYQVCDASTSDKEWEVQVVGIGLASEGTLVGRWDLGTLLAATV
jgi:hypothetical protein